MTNRRGFLKGLVVQVGAWQRSRPQFRKVVQLVRNGRLGRIARVEVGIGCDRSGGCRTPEKVPETFDYDAWLGPTDPNVPYNWTRCHNRDLKHIGDRLTPLAESFGYYRGVMDAL